MTYINSQIKLYLFFSINFIGALLFSLDSLAQQSNDDLPFNDDKRKFDYYFYEALNSKAQGKYDEAIDLFHHCYS